MNILWIITTQWRAQACGYSGDTNVRTPTLDRLARSALNYSQAITPHPFGPFARAALFTGIPSPKNGVENYFDPLPEDSATIAHRLNALGYSTAFFGKWHLGRRDPQAPLVGLAHAQIVVPPSARGGFTFWEGFESGFQLIDPWLHGTRLPEPTRFSGYQTDVLFDRAAQWTESTHRTPWFCAVSIEPPHPPYSQVPGFQPTDGHAVRLAENVPLEPTIAGQARRELAGYYAQIEATDAALGKLLDRIDQETTAILFTSVHGDLHGAHGLFRKGWPYEESVRVPLLVQIPGQAGEERTEAISLLDLCRLTEEFARSGRWQTSPREFERALLSMPSVVELPYQCDRKWWGMRSARRKLILNEGAPWLFFDLESDPQEMVNLANDSKYLDEINLWINRLQNSARD